MILKMLLQQKKGDLDKNEIHPHLKMNFLAVSYLGMRYSLFNKLMQFSYKNKKKKSNFFVNFFSEKCPPTRYV